MPEPNKAPVSELSVKIPYCRPAKTGYQESREELRISLDDKQRRGLCVMRAGLRETGAQRNNGRPIETNEDVVYWLLEKLDEHAAAQSNQS